MAVSLKEEEFGESHGQFHGHKLGPVAEPFSTTLQPTSENVLGMLRSAWLRDLRRAATLQRVSRRVFEIFAIIADVDRLTIGAKIAKSLIEHTIKYRYRYWLLGSDVN